MNTVFKELRKRIAYGKVIRINQKIAVNKENVEQLATYLENIKGKGLILAEASVYQAIAKIESQDKDLKQKRSKLLQKYFNCPKLKGEENG